MKILLTITKEKTRQLQILHLYVCEQYMRHKIRKCDHASYYDEYSQKYSTSYIIADCFHSDGSSGQCVIAYLIRVIDSGHKASPRGVCTRAVEMHKPRLCNFRGRRREGTSWGRQSDNAPESRRDQGVR